MSDTSTGRLLRRLALAAIPLLLGVLTGCGASTLDPYPEQLRYPVRSDILVTSVPTVDRYTPDLPGELEQFVANLATKEMQDKGFKTLNPDTLPTSLRDSIGEEMTRVFGTPAKPSVIARKSNLGDVEDEDVRNLLSGLKLDPRTLAQGSIQYRRTCLHCHGLPGDGRGPTGPWLNPHPRDYRQGLFKFISTAGSGDRKPRRDDLLRTLNRGVDGTAMPSFALEGAPVLDQLVSYVIHLSIRGETEFKLMETLLSRGDKKTKLDEDDATFIRDTAEKVLKSWSKADKPNVPGPYNESDELKASIRRGYTLFVDEKGAASCIKCHIDYGRQALFRYDTWGTLVRPANLTAGLYRGGRRPIDIYWRVMGGIPGANMPAAEQLKPNEAWDLVNFVLNVPYPAMLPDDVRTRVYPPSTAKEPAEHASVR
jgi:mono/diheme cytochrome c family protein